MLTIILVPILENEQILQGVEEMPPQLPDPVQTRPGSQENHPSGGGEGIHGSRRHQRRYENAQYPFHTDAVEYRVRDWEDRGLPNVVKFVRLVLFFTKVGDWSRENGDPCVHSPRDRRAGLRFQRLHHRVVRSH